MESAEHHIKYMLDHFYAEHKKLETDINGLPRAQALSDPACYHAISRLSNQQAHALADLVDCHGKEEVTGLLHRHPLHCDILLQSAVVRHALEKPRGYAGDKDLMLMICGKEDSGPTNYAVLKNRFYLELPGAEAVRQRARSLQQVLANLPEGSRVLNVACGPALEVQRLLRQAPDRAIRFDLIDHDLDTVKYVSRHLRNDRIACSLGNAFHIMKGNYRIAAPRAFSRSFCDPKRDFKGMRSLLAPLKYATRTLRKGEYDLVYSSGLFDYIRSFPGDHTRGAAALTKRLFDLVKPDGSLIIGNYLAQSDLNPHKWHHRAMMEVYSRWELIYRTPDEIRGFMAAVPHRDYSMTLTDEYFEPRDGALRGAIGFLIVTKRG